MLTLTRHTGCAFYCLPPGPRRITINPNKCACLTVGKLPPPSLSFCPRPRSSHRHDLHRVSPLQRDCEYSKAFAALGSKILLWTIQNSVYPALLCLSPSHQEYAMGANAPTLRADINQFESAQRLATRLLIGLRHVPYGERLRHLNLVLLERRCLRADLILAFKMFKGEVDLNPSEVILRPPRVGLRGHTYRLMHDPSLLRRRSGAFSDLIVKFWNWFPSHRVLLPSVSVFKQELDHDWSEIVPAAPVQLLSQFIDTLLNTVTPDYSRFPLSPKPRTAYVVIIGPHGHSYH